MGKPKALFRRAGFVQWQVLLMWEKCSILITCVRGYSIQLHTVSAPPQPNPLFYMSRPIRQMFENCATAVKCE